MLHCKNVRVIITIATLHTQYYCTVLITYLAVVISVASVQRVLLYPHDYCVRTSHRDSNCYILLGAIMGTPNRCNSDNHNNFKMTFTFLQCILYLEYHDMSVVLHRPHHTQLSVYDSSNDIVGILHIYVSCNTIGII